MHPNADQLNASRFLLDSSPLSITFTKIQKMAFSLISMFRGWYFMVGAVEVS